MIAYIEGDIISVHFLPKQTYIVVLTKSGIGYQVFVPSNGDYVVGDSIKLFTSFQVREDSQSLYGFRKQEDKDVFERIINVSGIGPKTGLAVISNFSMQEFKNILANADVISLSKVSGLGQKGAKKIILDLQGVYVQDVEQTADVDSNLIDELEIALESLGFKGKEMESMKKKGIGVLKENPNISIETLVSDVLRK